MKAFVVLAVAFCTAAAALAQSSESSIRLEEGAGRELTAARCVICHSLDYLEMNAPVMTPANWEKSVRKMIDVFGAPLTEEEAKQIIQYLGEHYSARANL